MGKKRAKVARPARAWAWSLGTVVAAAGILRLLGIGWGLPHTFNADEPHVLNLAVSFGAGSLRPYAFKYPTLWPYALFAAFGAFFAVWSGLGLRKSVTDFVGLYAWRPTPFYLIGRGLAALSSLVGLWTLGRVENESRTGARADGRPWAAALLAVSPALCESARSAKPDCAMFAFACGAWLFAHRVQRAGERRDYWRCGALSGLALSCQYTAAPLAALVALAHIFSARRGRLRWALEGLSLCALAFLAGSPFAALDFPNFWINVEDLIEIKHLAPGDNLSTLARVMENLWSFAGAGSIAGAAACLGLGRLFWSDRLRAGLYVCVIALYVYLLSTNPDGGWPRYLFGAFPAMALLAAEGLALLDAPKRPLLTALLAVLALLPGAAVSLDAGLELRRPDTRELAEVWLEKNVPAGSEILLDLPHASPRVVMEREQVVELARRARANGSPRARLFEGMAKTHPGGGYKVHRIARTGRDLYTFSRLVELSQADAPTLDVSSGLAAARRAGVEFIVTSGHGASWARAPELARFFRELEEQAALAAAFSSEPGASAGPVVRVWTLK